MVSRILFVLGLLDVASSRRVQEAARSAVQSEESVHGPVATKLAKDGISANKADTGPVFELPHVAEKQVADTVAIFADYDGCFDFLNPKLAVLGARNSPTFFAKYGKTAEYISERRKIISYLKKITSGASRVLLFVGSNRQSRQFDLALKMDGSGKTSAIVDGGYEAIAEGIGKEVSGKPWELNKALLADHGPSFRGWTDEEMKNHANDETGKAWGPGADDQLYQPLTSRGDFQITNEQELKWLMVQNNLKQLRDMGTVDVYYIDDDPRGKHFLDYTGEKFQAQHSKWGSGYTDITYHTVKFDYMDYILDGENKSVEGKEWL